MALFESSQNGLVMEWIANSQFTVTIPLKQACLGCRCVRQRGRMSASVPMQDGGRPERATGTAPAPAASTLPTIPDHEMLRVVGRGSYGEVWLARNILGEFRAVKVIYRQAFEHDRPYERELEGVRRFEPISRAHPSQLNVLHVGRNDAAGCFYYVMELADDAGGIDATPNDGGWAHDSQEPAEDSSSRHPTSRIQRPESYAPRTLKTDLDRCGRLPVDECLRIGLALTAALEHLHAHGLVHRDVKPSNIIIVHGVPKLADIGLVASMEATMSFVGTSGFLPPEGPGTPKADLYSLGKVLYEASTGHDRQEFPKLPAQFAEWDDAPRLVELNAVILKACAQDPRERYQSAHDMAADLVLLQRGQSVKRLRLVERRLALFTRAGIVALLLLAVAAGLYWGARHQARANARQLYVADMNRAMQSWEGGNVILARQLLDTHRQLQPEMLGFEWRLLDRLCQQSDAHVTLRGHERTVWSLAFSPDGNWIASGSGDRTVKLWQTASGNLVVTLAGHGSFVHAVAFSPDGKHLASGSRDFTVKLWNTESRSEEATFTGHSDAVRAVAFSSNGQFLVSASEDKTMRWWSLAAMQEISALPTGFTIEQLRFAPDGRVLAACGADRRIYFWETATRGELPAVELHQAQVLDAAYSSDGRMLATSSFDGRIKLWDTVARQELATLGQGAPVHCVAFAPGDQILGAATDDGVIRLWSIARREVVTTLRGHTGNVRALTFAPRGDRLATAGDDQTVRLWDVSDAALNKDTLKHTGLVNGVAFAPDGRSLATSAGDGTLRIWDADTRQVKAVHEAGRGAVWSVAFAPDGKAVVTGGADGSVRMWTSHGLAERWSVPAHQGGVDAVSFSPDGRWIASASRDQTLKLWQSDSGQAQASLTVTGNVVRTVSFTPDGTMLACGGTDGRLRLWKFSSTNGLTVLEGRQGEIRALAFSRDGRMLVSGGADRTIRVWDVKRTRSCRRSQVIPPSSVRWRFRPTGRPLRRAVGTAR